MGLLTDFFIASLDELQGLDPTRGPSERFPTVEAKGFDPVELSQLEVRMTNNAGPHINQPIVKENGSTWVIDLEQGFAPALAAMDAEQIERFGEEWLLSDDETEVLARVAALSRQGVETGKRLYVWVSE